MQFDTSDVQVIFRDSDIEDRRWDIQVVQSGGYNKLENKRVLPMSDELRIERCEGFTRGMCVPVGMPGDEITP